MGIDLFIDSYNKLDDFMRIKLKKDLTVSHAKLLSEMSKLDNVFARLETKLQAYRALRNAIVHKHREGETPIAIPNHDVVLDYQRIVHYALTPPLALNSIAVTKIKAVYLTGNGQSFEKLKGVITPHSLPMINPTMLDKKLHV